LSPQAQIRALLILALVAAGVLLADLVLLGLVALSAARVRDGKRPILAQKWSFVDFFFGSQFVLAGVLAFSFVAGIAAVAFGPTRISPNLPTDQQMAAFMRAHPTALFVSLAAQDAFFIAVPLIYFRFKYKLKPRDLGLSTQRLARWLVIALGLAVVIVGLVQPAERLNEAALKHYHDVRLVKAAERLAERSSPEALVEDLVGAWSPFATVFAVAILAPIAEEIYFRAFTYNILKARFGIIAGILASSVIFASIHLDPARFPTYFVLAVALAYSYERTRNLLVPMAIHFLNNLVAVIALYWLR
jgi:membrane protease YdiL (CAAX protease family)